MHAFTLSRFRFGTLSSRITVLYAIVFTAIFSAFILVASGGIERYAAGMIEDEMAANAKVFNEMLDLRGQQLRTSADVVSGDFGFRAAVAIGDEPTIASALESLKSRTGAPFAFVVTLEGDAIGTPADMSANQLDRIWLALDEGKQNGIAKFGQNYAGAVAAPIEMPDLAGWLVLARPLGAASMNELAGISSVALTARIADANTANDAAITALNSTTRIKESGEKMLYRMTALPSLDDSLEPRLLLSMSLDKALQAYRPIIWLLIGLSVVGLAMTTCVGWAVARGITKPLAKLDHAAKRVSAGDSVRVDVESSDEVGRLADSFNVMVQAISDREHQITHIALHDALTGLPNRKLFHEQLDFALKRLADDQKLALLYFDLDDFKAVNDTMGHPVGDKLLVDIGHLLSRELDHAFIARLGGDEFAIIVENLDSDRAIALVAEKLRKCFDRHFLIEDHAIETTTSIGVAVAPGDGMDAETLVRNADLALYRAKLEGKGVYRFFETSMDEQARKRRQMEVDMRIAIREGQFVLNYQPLVSLADERVIGFEALLRWEHPLHGVVSPADFIPLAEETGLIIQIGEWVMKEACRQAVHWPEDVRVAVNVSPIQFKHPGLQSVILQALANSGLEPNRLEIEITESLFIENIERTTEMLEKLHALGIRIALDDFGTGYSSLGYLRSMPLDKIKIDRSFVEDLADNEGASAIIRAITTLATALGMETIAEGVEDLIQLDKLRTEGCTQVQGYLLSRPVPVEDVWALIASIAAPAQVASRRVA